MLVGNEKGEQLHKVSLREYLGNIRKYLTNPNRGRATERTCSANRDSHVLVSAQACFLPMPKEGSAEFNPVLFNYQSTKGTRRCCRSWRPARAPAPRHRQQARRLPAGPAWGQRLFFNHKGERAA